MRYPVRWLLILTTLLAVGIVLGGCDSGAAPTSAPAQNTSAPPAQPATATPPPQVATTAPPAPAPTVPAATSAPPTAAAGHVS